MTKRVSIADLRLQRALEQSLLESRTLETRSRFEIATEQVARRYPGARFAGLTAQGRVLWPSVGRFYEPLPLNGAGTAWFDESCTMWLWEPPNSR